MERAVTDLVAAFPFGTCSFLKDQFSGTGRSTSINNQKSQKETNEANHLNTYHPLLVSYELQ